MYDQLITRACLSTLLTLATVAACEVEPDDLDGLAEDEALRDAETIEPDDAPAELTDEALATPAVESSQSVGLDTDLLDPGSQPGPGEPLFPTGVCRPGFVQAGARLCITQVAQNAERYRLAAVHCRDQRAQICSYEDLTYLYYRSALDANYNPNGHWTGNIVADDQVLCGNANITSDNDPDIQNFEGTCSKNDQQSYWCCHGDET